jgi:hypothetical protein
VPQAFAQVMTVDGEPVDPSLCAAPPTDDEGTTTLAAPAGEVALAVRAEPGAAFRSVLLRPDETVALEVRLARP